MDSREIRDKGQGHVSLDRALASAEARTDHSRTFPNIAECTLAADFGKSRQLSKVYPRSYRSWPINYLCHTV